MPPPRSFSGKRASTIDVILTEAAKTGNMESAIKKHGASLSEADAEVLRKLTPAELKAVGGLRKKLAPLGRAVSDNNGGVF